MPMPTTKLSRLEAMMAAGDWRGALKLAASFPRLGPYEVPITRGWEAWARPDFYRQLGYDIDELKAAGRRALEEAYGGR